MTRTSWWANVLAFFFSAAFLLCRKSVVAAAVAVTQVSASTTVTTITFGSSPTIGHIVAIVRSADSSGTSTSVTDSNSNGLPLVCTVVNGTAKSYIYAYQVPSGGVTGVYTVNTFGGTTAQGGIEVQGGSLSTLQCGTGTFSTTTSGATSSIAHVGSGSIKICNEATGVYQTETIDGVSVTGFGQNGPRAGYITSSGATTNSSCAVTFTTNKTGSIALVAIWPGPSILQKIACGSGGTCTVTAPTNGNSEVVQIDVVASSAGDTVSDSVGAFTPQHFSCAASNVLCLETFDKLISGSAGTTITITAASLVNAQFVELSGLPATGINTFTGGTSASGASLAGTLAGVSAGDAQISMGDSTAAIGTLTTTFSNNNVGKTTIIGGAGKTRGEVTLATGTSSSAWTYGLTTSASNITLEYADYAGPAATPAPSTLFIDPTTQMGFDRFPTIGLVDPATIIRPLHRNMLCIMRLDGGDECWRWGALPFEMAATR